MITRAIKLGCAAAALLALSQPSAGAYQLKPTGTENEQTIVKLSKGLPGSFWSGISRRLIEHFTTNVHEEITNRIWGCKTPANGNVQDKTCSNSKAAPAAVIYGVQWNDNPPFKLDSTDEDECEINRPIRLPDRQPNCWRILFGDAAKRAAKGGHFHQKNGMALIYRTHFGDLQFQHSMASWDGQKMSDTKALVMMWAEFTYKVSTGAIGPRTKLQDIDVAGFSKVLGRYWGDVTTLFTYGVNKYANDIPDVAFGSLLHMIQDSFSGSHVSREAPSGTCGDSNEPDAGRVLEFHAYGNQDGDKHAKEDSRNLMLAGLVESPDNNVVVVGQYLKSLRDKGESWEKVHSYLDSCVYHVHPDDADNPAGPGAFVE